MTDFLIKIFIKNKDKNDPAVREKYASLAGFTGIVVNVLLFIGKLIVGILSASVAIIADAFNNISDAGSAIVTLIGFRLSNKPVDKEHPLGHGRLEYISGFIVDMLIILVGFELFKSSFEKILHPTMPAVETITFILLGVAILVKLWLYFFYKKIGTRIQSTALKASAADSLSDCIATSLVLVSSITVKAFSFSVDGWVGILVAVFILFTGIKAAKETIDLLLGSPPDPAFIQEIYDFTKEYPRIVGIHDVIVHDYGPGRQIVSFHAEVPSDSDINIAHEEVDTLERDMHAKFGCIVTVHLDPIVVNDPVVNEWREIAEMSAKEVNADFSIHDFRITKGETNVNLIFDLVLPADSEISTEEAENAVAEKIREKRANCFCVIRAEHPFI
ncbi:MAG: cation transporter [Clostridia bacterium]|nr:cation transporter [Clostridia bacterium]